MKATEETPLMSSFPQLSEDSDPTFAPSTDLTTDLNSRRIPQIIAHRGYKSQFPENTIPAFDAAVRVGANAIETDVHLSKDGIVVLSHDPTLNRCFGLKDKIIDCEWSYLSTLKTVQEPPSHMPRLLDLLLWLSEENHSERERIWALLDIKVPWPRLLEPVYQLSANERVKLDNDAEFLMMRIAETIKEAEEVVMMRKTSSLNRTPRPWCDRIVLGCWAASYLPLCGHYLPGYPITHIGFSIPYARQFLKVPGVSFNMLQTILVGPIGAAFMRDVKAANRELFVWTVNKEEWMKWAITKEVSGVITDDPGKFKEVAGDYDEQEPKRVVSKREFGRLLWWNFVVFIFSFLFRCRHGFTADPEKIKVEIQQRRGQIEDVVVKTDAWRKVEDGE